MEFGKIIRRAWDILWRHKALWVFGIAAALFGGQRLPSGPNMRYGLSQGDIERWRQGMPFMPGAPFGGAPLPQIEQWGPIVAALIGLLFVIGLALFVVRVIVRYTSLGAMIGMVNDIEQANETSFRTGFRQGWRRFLRLFAQDLIIGLVVAIIVIGVMIVFALLAGLLIALPVVLLVNTMDGPNWLAVVWGVGVGLILLLLFIVAMLAVGAGVTLVREYSFRSSVIDQRGVFDALGDGVSLARGRFRESILMWLLLAAINLAIGLISIPFVLLGLGLVAVPAIMAAQATDSPAGLLVALPFLALFIVAALFVGGLYEVFASSVWTLTYRDLKSMPVLERA